MAIRIDGFEELFTCYDAHIDQPGESCWGSEEQLEGLESIDGGLRVYFTAPDGGFHTDVEAHIANIQRMWDAMLPRMSSPYVSGHNYLAIVEGMESPTTKAQVDAFLNSLDPFRVAGGIPIYNPDNPLGGCSKESGKGLTELGRYMIHSMWHRLQPAHWWVDIAHMSYRSMEETLFLGGRNRICYSHGGIVHDGIIDPVLVDGNIERCISKEIALKVIEGGGIVCLSPAKPFYYSIAPDSEFIRHIKWLGKVSHWNGVGIGTDYGGILDKWRLPGCETLDGCFRTVIKALLDAGLSERQVRRVVGTNVEEWFSKGQQKMLMHL